MTYTEMEAALRAVSNRLWDSPCGQEKPCLRREEERPLSKKERGLGWARRPFDAYSPEAMCGECRAYWYAQMAYLTVQRLNHYSKAEAVTK